MTREEKSVGSISQKRIRVLLLADRCLRAVTRQDNGIIGQSEQFFAYSAQKQIAIASGQIPSPDPSPEQDIASDQDAFPGRVETQASGAMARDFEHIDFPTEQSLVPALPQNFINRDRLEAERKPLPHEKIRIAHHGNRLLVTDNGTIVAGAHSRGISHVIPMPVRQNKQPDFLATKRFICPLGRVEENQTALSWRSETVGGVRAAGKSFELHRLSRVETTNLIFLAQPANQGNQL